MSAANDAFSKADSAAGGGGPQVETVAVTAGSVWDTENRGRGFRHDIFRDYLHNGREEVDGDWERCVRSCVDCALIRTWWSAPEALCQECELSRVDTKHCRVDTKHTRSGGTMKHTGSGGTMKHTGSGGTMKHTGPVGQEIHRSGGTGNTQDPVGHEIHRDPVGLETHRDPVGLEAHRDPVGLESHSSKPTSWTSWPRSARGDGPWYDDNGMEVADPNIPCSGVPDHPVPTELWQGWRTEQGMSHCNRRFPADTLELGARADPIVQLHIRSDPVPVLWFHTAQRERARQLGLIVPVEEGPSPYGDFHLPHKMEGLFLDPSKTYLRRCRQTEQLCLQMKRVEAGYRINISAVEGGRDGVSYGPEARKLPFRHLVFRNVAGRPQVVREDLPDDRTEMRLDVLAQLAQEAQVSDQYAWSELVLYGMRSLPACSPSTHSWPLYKGAYSELKFLQQNRRQQREQGCISAPMLAPRFEPERRHPKSVDVSVKLDGTVKYRETTDYGSKRVRRRWAALKLRLLQDSLQPGHSGFSKKGHPGPDSYNACLSKERIAALDFGSVFNFAEALAILLTAGVPVDLKIDDFTSFFTQFPLAVMEEWLTTQLLSSQGADINLRPDFGGGLWPTATSRVNFNVCQIVDHYIWAEQLRGEWRILPWSRELVQLCDDFFARRRSSGNHGRFFTCFAWIDDNSRGSLCVLTAIVSRLQYRVWDELNWIWDRKKAAIYRFGDPVVPPVTGVCLVLHQGRIRLPVTKSQKYVVAISTILTAAEKHPQSLAPSQDMESCMGKIIHAADIAIDIWIYFLDLVAELRGRWRSQWVQLTKTAKARLRDIRSCLEAPFGRPLASYRLRPGSDGLPVWRTWTDASRREGSFFGAAGGFIHKWGSNRIYFFAEQWPESMVEANDISVLEHQAATIARRWQDRLSDTSLPPLSAEQASPREYLIQYGDNESTFRYVLNNMRAGAGGMRALTAERAALEWRRNTCVCGVWIPRELNQAADALANLDLQLFVSLACEMFPARQLIFCRLSVPDHWLVSDPLHVASRRHR